MESAEQIPSEEGMEQPVAEEAIPLDADFSFPISQHNGVSLRNLVNLIYSRGELISKATDGIFLADKGLVDALKDDSCTYAVANFIHAVREYEEQHAQPNRKLYDVLTKGSGDAREQPLFFLITTAGTDKESICYELHMKALDLLAGRKIDHTFYPVVYGLTDEDDWHDEANWYKANPSLGQTIQIQRVRDAYQEALDNPAEENVFKQLRLNMWVSSLTRFIPEHMRCLLMRSLSSTTH